jgi:ABC-type uncharacterized transport system ATPase subunit
VNIQAVERTLEIEVAPESLGAPERGAPGLLIASGLTKTFGHGVANQAIDLEVRAGEILVVLGDNGSGKSTLIDILAGYATPDRGTISFDEPSPRASAPFHARWRSPRI